MRSGSCARTALTHADPVEARRNTSHSSLYVIGRVIDADWRERNRLLSDGISALVQPPTSAPMVFGLTLGGSVANYTYAAYMQKHLVNSAGMSRGTASLISVLTLIGFTAIQPVFGALSDPIGRRSLRLSFGVLGTFGTVPLFTLFGMNKRPMLAFVLVMTALAIVAMYSSVSTISRAELFPLEVRSFGLAVPYAL